MNRSQQLSEKQGIKVIPNKKVRYSKLNILDFLPSTKNL